MDWYRQTPTGWLLRLHVQPGAKTSSVCGMHGEALKLRIAAPPVEGRANAALVAFVAAQLGVPRRAVSVAKGAGSRDKQLRVDEPSADPLRLLQSVRM